jgi:hypothetical protein
MRFRIVSDELSLNIGTQLAEFLTERHEEIISRWVAAVHLDEKISVSETLTHDQLKDHLPQLLKNLNDTLCNVSSRDIKQQASVTAATHGQMRFHEGYGISDLLQEMRDLRSTLIPYLIEFQEHHPHVGAARQMFLIVTVHRFLDDAIRISVEEFIAEDKQTARE